jgi:hypothetical protein
MRIRKWLDAGIKPGFIAQKMECPVQYVYNVKNKMKKEHISKVRSIAAAARWKRKQLRVAKPTPKSTLLRDHIRTIVLEELHNILDDLRICLK